MSRGRHINYQKAIRKRLLLSVLFLTTHAATFLFMPFAGQTRDETYSKKALLIVGLVFWISAILGYLFLFLGNSYRRSFVKRRMDGDFAMGRRAGIITFFSTFPGAIADTFFIVALVALVITYLRGNINNYLTFVLLAVLSISLNLHCIFNGRIFITTKYKRVVRRGENNE